MSDNEYNGCSDGNCLLRLEPLRQHTNGGCRCLRDVPLPLRLAITRKITVQMEEIKRLQELLNETERTVANALHNLKMYSLEERYVGSKSPFHQRISMVIHTIASERTIK